MTRMKTDIKYWLPPTRNITQQAFQPFLEQLENELWTDTQIGLNHNDQEVVCKERSIPLPHGFSLCERRWHRIEYADGGWINYVPDTPTQYEVRDSGNKTVYYLIPEGEH